MYEAEVKKLHDYPCQPERWIGVDLNTTGHAVVAADLFPAE